MYADPFDALPNFREAVPTPDDLNTDGCLRLLSAVKASVAYDYWKVCDQPYEAISHAEMEKPSDYILKSRTLLESFIKETMPEKAARFMSGIKAIKASGKTLKDVAKATDSGKRSHKKKIPISQMPLYSERTHHQKQINNVKIC